MSSCQHQTGSHDAHAEANLSRETLTQSRFNNNKKSHKIQRCTHICSTNTHNSFQRLLWNIPYILCQNGLSPLFANSSIFGSFAVEPHRNSMYSRNDCVESNNRNFRFPVRTANNNYYMGLGLLKWWRMYCTLMWRRPEESHTEPPQSSREIPFANPRICSRDVWAI